METNLIKLTIDTNVLVVQNNTSIYTQRDDSMPLIKNDTMKGLNMLSEFKRNNPAAMTTTNNVRCRRRRRSAPLAVQVCTKGEQTASRERDEV